MAYNPSLMPTNLTEWNELIEHYYNLGQRQYAEAQARITAQAEAAWSKLPAGESKPDLAAYVAQALSMLEPARTRAEWENHFRAAGYYPTPQPVEQPLSLEQLKSLKLADLAAAFHTACLNATITTAEGWLADADETANRNVQGLVLTLESQQLANATIGENGEVLLEGDEPTVMFCDHANIFHEVSLEQLRAIQLAIIAHGQALYARKWELRSLIEAAQTESGLNAIQVSFS